MKLALITTTINVPTVLEVHTRNVPPGCTLDLVVAGDVRTPPEARDLVEELGGTYLGVTGELVERWDTHRAVGVNSIQRRNLALLHALTLGPDVVVTVDDDNRPHDPVTYLGEFVDGVTRVGEYLTVSSNGWYNPGNVLEPPVHHRGFPLAQRHDRRVISTTRYRPTVVGGNVPRVGVAAGLWFGDPDVDAVERIVAQPYVTGFRSDSGRRDVVLDVGTWAPFNTQNTAYRWEVAPLMQCLVGVGRYDDIVMSYCARRVMDDLGWYVRYGYPVTHQDRNQHDLVTDLERELWGYRNLPRVLAALHRIGSWAMSDPTPLIRLAQVYRGLETLLPRETNDANQAWLVDAVTAVDEGSQRRKERTDD